MKRIQYIAVIIMLCLGLTSTFHLWGAWVHADSGLVSRAEVDALRQELERVKTRLDDTQKDLVSLQQKVALPLPQPTKSADALVTMRLGSHPLLGAPDAPLTLIEFSDYQCPYCRQFVENTFPALKRDYIETGKLRYTFRDLPLDRIHPQARKAAEAAHCAGEQGKYWEMHDLLFQYQQALQIESLKGYAQHLGLDVPAFEDCLVQGTYASAVQQNLDEGTAAGVRGTPSFVLGKTRPDGSVQGIVLRGAQPIVAFRQAIERLLGEQ
jgi:protein-disulfide isomerase